MARKLYDGYSITELRTHARKLGIDRRTLMTGPQLLAAARAGWAAGRIAAERAVLDAHGGTIAVGTLLRHKSSGTVMRVTGVVQELERSYGEANGPLWFTAEYVEIGERDGGLVGAWKTRPDGAVALARYRNDEQARRVEGGFAAGRHMLWQHEAI